jgi:2'-5' RNA ligase
VRAFISIEIPENIKDNIEKSIDEMKFTLSPLKWVDKKNLHITLKFLGWVVDEKVDGMISSVADLAKGFGSIKMNFAGLGVFPNAKHPRVIWVGINEGSDKIKELAEKIDARLSSEGYRKEEEREFSPHLTIGRIKEKIDAEPLGKFMEKNATTEFGGFTAEHISVMKSTLRRSGPIYEEIKQVRLSS